MVTLFKFNSIAGNTPMRSNSNRRSGGVSATRMSIRKRRNGKQLKKTLRFDISTRQFLLSLPSSQARPSHLEAK